jgi:hypothetical protein
MGATGTRSEHAPTVTAVWNDALLEIRRRHNEVESVPAPTQAPIEGYEPAFE